MGKASSLCVCVEGTGSSVALNLWGRHRLCVCVCVKDTGSSGALKFQGNVCMNVRKKGNWNFNLVCMCVYS